MAPSAHAATGGPAGAAPNGRSANEQWSFDFVHDPLATGHAMRVLTVVDDCTREYPLLAVDYSLPSERVIAPLERGRLSQPAGAPRLRSPYYHDASVVAPVAHDTNHSVPSWHRNDLTNETCAPDAAGIAAGCVQSDTRHVVYRAPTRTSTN